jgi:hypothetical protein
MTNLIEPNQILEQAAKSLTDRTVTKPPVQDLITALLESEATAKKNKPEVNFSQLIGNWRLCFVSSKQTAKTTEKSGRYLPSFLNIQLGYSPTTLEKLELGNDPEFTPGSIQNIIQVASVKFTINGPAKFYPKKSLLAFDFTRMKVQMFGLTLYNGYIRDGKNSEAKFYQRKINQQAFFAYFLLAEEAIAARGRGGGLALWARICAN